MTVATGEQIRRIQSHLPPDSDKDFGWDEDRISALLLATNFSTAQTIRQFWLERVTESFGFVDVSETGSSRSLSQIYTNAKSMLDYWDKQVEAEGVVNVRRPISFGEIERG